jgi:hypothetical protein
MDQTTANNLLQQNLATGRFGDQTTLERELTQTDIKSAEDMLPLLVEQQRLANVGAYRGMQDSRIGQLIALLQANDKNNILDEGAASDANRQLQSFLSNYNFTTNYQGR